MSARKLSNNLEFQFREPDRSIGAYTEMEFVSRVIDLTYLVVKHKLDLEESEVRIVASSPGNVREVLRAHLDKHPRH